MTGQHYQIYQALGANLPLKSPSPDDINAWVQQRIGSLNFVFRTLLFVLICAVGYGLAMVFVTPWLAKGLGYFNNYTLAPVLLLVFFVIGMIADRS